MTIVKLPERIMRLEELAYNLWWSWHEDARHLFRYLDHPLWRMSVHNPVKLLHEVSVNKLLAASNDPAFLARYDAVMNTFDAEMQVARDWFGAFPREGKPEPVAYFSMEFAFHNSLPIYAGGLGVLAGDICKEASDMGLPMVAVGFMYPQGYFHQHINADGEQQEVYRQLDFRAAPISRVFSPEGDQVITTVPLGDAALAIGAWQVEVGRTRVYLLDTNLEENPPAFRQIDTRLYVADREQRLLQEVVLGIGGVRVLRALKVNPVLWHANEGHTAFMMLERARELVAGGLSFDKAAAQVRANSVFTTHTPVLAGHDIFPIPLVERYFSAYWPALGINRETFLQMGGQDGTTPPTFNMTALALRMADQRSAVSWLHGKVTRKMWHSLWPQVPENQVPISYVTNGVHVPSWIAPEMYRLFENYIGKDWVKEPDDAKQWDRTLDIPDKEIWRVRQVLKRKLFGAMREGARSRWVQDNIPSRQVLAMGALLSPDALTIGYARRFAEYKRPDLLFKDIERLKKIVTNPWHPVQIVFAGKSHPADLPSKHLLQQVYQQVMSRDFQGRIAFAEDYDTHIARYLVQGVDVWLNTPRRLQEASGTSGIKASLNGVLHLSVLDGWWREGFHGANGWAINGETVFPDPAQEDQADAEALYHLLEEEITPLYYARERSGLPHGWIRMVKEAIRSVIPVFCARRMLKEYADKMYRVAARPG
ncbi:MAG: alpha-glucan family phosphorylase [Chloroflexota bacterium]